MTSASRLPTFTEAVHKSVTLGCVFMLMKLNNCVVVCGSVLKMGIVVMCVSSSILFKCESRLGYLFVLSWARVRRVAKGSILSK